MPRVHRTIAGLLLVVGCRGPRPVAVPPTAGERPDPAGLPVTVAPPAPSYIAIYELTRGRSLARISPVTVDPVDTLLLPAPITPPAPGRTALGPRLAVTNPSGAEHPLGEVGTWGAGRVTWTRPSEARGRAGGPDRPFWFIIWLAHPVTPAMDSVAAALELPCCTDASGLAAQVGAAFGLPSEQVRVVAPR